jgi:hypothetical protein
MREAAAAVSKGVCRECIELRLGVPQLGRGEPCCAISSTTSSRVRVSQAVASATAPSSPRADAGTSLERIEALLAQGLERAEGQGDLGPDSNIIALARFFVAALQGSRLTGKVCPNRQVVVDVAERTLRVLD